MQMYDPKTPVAGTTGYDFLNQANGLFVNPRGLEKLRQVYADFVQTEVDLPELIADKKKLIMAARSFSSPVKTDDADVLLLTASTFREFPDLWTGPSLTSSVIDAGLTIEHLGEYNKGYYDEDGTWTKAEDGFYYPPTGPLSYPYLFSLKARKK